MGPSRLLLDASLDGCRSYLRRPSATVRLCHAPAASLSAATTALAYNSTLDTALASTADLPYGISALEQALIAPLATQTASPSAPRSHPYSPPSAAHLRAPSSERQAGTTRRASRRRLADPSYSKPTLTCPCSWCGFPRTRHSRGRLTCVSEPRCCATTSNSGQARTPDSPHTERHVATPPSSCWQQSTRARRGSPDRRSDGASSHEQATQVG
jgi:hypothetical protein